MVSTGSIRGGSAITTPGRSAPQPGVLRFGAGVGGGWLLIAAASLCFGLLASAAAQPAAAAISQRADVKILPAIGTGTPRGRSFVRLSAYLSSRDASSLRPQHQANPVGRVVMTFPSGSYIAPSKTGLPVCNQPAGQGAKVIALCSRSKIGSGWALVNTGQTVAGPRTQLTGAPAPCAPEAGDPATWTQYTRTWQTGTLGCVPIGHLWNRVSVYLGGIPEGRTTPSPTSIVFVSENIASIVAFGGTITKNQLVVRLPSLYGSGSYPGELFFGWVLSDFRVQITNPKYLISGACPSTRRWTVNTKATYSQRKSTDGLVWDPVLKANRPITSADIAAGVPAETVAPVPAGTSINSVTGCRT